MLSREDYVKRLSISIEGDSTTIFTTLEGLKIAKGYTRIVVGDYMPYIEFSAGNLFKENFYVPDNEKLRVEFPDRYYYIVYRTNDISNVKIYFQNKLVSYEDYKIGYYYISPFDLLANGNVIIEKLYRKKKK